MNLITVIPLTRQKVAETLSYFTSSEISIGAIVSVPLRSRTIHGIVIETKPVADIKAEIKDAPYEIRKLGKVKSNAFFSAEFMEACGILANYYAANAGSVINAVTSDILLEKANKIIAPVGAPSRDSSSLISQEKSGEIYAVQGDDEDRMSSWRSLIRQEFAKKKSIVFHAPTIEDSEALFSALRKGIEDYIFKLNGNVTKKKILETWQQIAQTDHPIVVIAAGSFSTLPRADISVVVLERENSRGWISPKAPYLDLRRALETIAARQGKTLFLADSLLRIETLYRLDRNEIDPGSPFKWRSVSGAKDSLVNMLNAETLASRDENASGKKRFRVISPELESVVEKNREDNSHLFIFAVRRGLASITVCDDCETIVTCKNCSAPAVLHASRVSGNNFFLCHKCGEIMNADISCEKCRGVRLTPLGVGIDRVEQEIREKFRGVEIVKVDADITKTDKQINLALEKFKEKPGSVLLGTELALARIREKVDHVAVASLDSLLALPDFRAPEKIMYTLVRLRSLATRTILAQTRKPEEKIFEYGLKGNLSDFYRGILDERKRFFYPPFSTLIKITISGKKDAIAVMMADIRKLASPREIDIFPAFTSTAKGNSVIHGLIKVPANEWPDSDLVAKLKSLPPNVGVRVDPESLL
jgi:primosomal protein N' (replication factor Y)